jgi:hypothetical protein
VEAESDGTLSTFVSRIGVDPASDPDLAVMVALLAA